MSERLLVYTLRALAALVVTVLGGLALYISFQHMVELAYRHAVTGITAVAFPVTVDGLEVISAAVLVYDRYARRRSGLLPWSVLWFGAGVSVAANAAVAPDNPIARLIYAMSAICLIAAVKLLTHLLQPPPSRDTTRPQRKAAPPADVDSHSTRPAPRTGGTAPGGAAGDTGVVTGHTRRRPKGDVARRVPRAPDAYQRWCRIWAATAHEPVVTGQVAATHGVSKRTLQFIHAAGRQGLLDPVPDLTQTHRARLEDMSHDTTHD